MLHVARSFENSLAFQYKLFYVKPSEKITVLLTDFSDFGNAGADSVPYDLVTVKIAPLSFAYETFTANERMNYLMNHELVHVATADRAVGRDQFFRSLFRGKVAPLSDHPETIGYFYLTSPRRAAPRWYMEGIAVFLDTWMAGGIGRAQGPYDEMVFRSMVRDGSRFYDPLGLSSELTKADFRLEANAYLYGTRSDTRLYLFGRVAHPVGVADRREPRVLRVAVPTGLRHPPRARVVGLDRVRARLPDEESRGDQEESGDDLSRRVTTGTRVAVARLHRSPEPHGLRRHELSRRARPPRRDLARRRRD